ncbi:MAG: 2-amino-4-hydroxy-6-hydroxymethyldihydropteridine diphosphokinase, partial [Gammaproteobacteria bacterium]
LADCTVIKSSRLYQSPPLGPQDQPDFINAVVKIHTSTLPHDLLNLLLAIENKHGRIRQQHWGARTLDLDILLYGDQCINDPNLTIPHPEMLKRHFVLAPLREIEPDLVLPDGKKLALRLKDMLTFSVISIPQ